MLYKVKEKYTIISIQVFKIDIDIYLHYMKITTKYYKHLVIFRKVTIGNQLGIMKAWNNSLQYTFSNIHKDDSV